MPVFFSLAQDFQKLVLGCFLPHHCSPLGPQHWPRPPAQFQAISIALVLGTNNVGNFFPNPPPPHRPPQKAHYYVHPTCLPAIHVLADRKMVLLVVTHAFTSWLRIRPVVALHPPHSVGAPGTGQWHSAHMFMALHSLGICTACEQHLNPLGQSPCHRDKHHIRTPQCDFRGPTSPPGGVFCFHCNPPALL